MDYDQIAKGLLPAVFLIHTYHSRLIPEGVAEAFQIFLQDSTFYQNDLAMKNTSDVIGGKLITVCSLSQVGMLLIL
jgi:hypothetical protein